jgi:hypothetical protein
MKNIRANTSTGQVADQKKRLDDPKLNPGNKHVKRGGRSLG